jgi:desulfoferrodoxin-like iron-binding protein
MLRPADGNQTVKTAGGTKMTSQLGKRYKCAKCGTEALCTKAGAGKLECCGEEMKTQEAKPIPSSD